MDMNKVIARINELAAKNKTVGEGAKISIRGLGKIRLAAVNGKTKKDRISVVIHRYV